MTMSSRRRDRIAPLVAAILAVGTSSTFAADAPKVPEGFEARLVASVPAVEFPCQVATGPGGQLFVAEDPMDQVGPYESFNGRILRFVDGRDPAVFAEGFRAVQGMAWHDGALYVSHMPFLTVVKDADGDGKADNKVDLFKDLGQTKNQGLNDHIVSGLQFGMDGWLYISVGDKGIPKATGPDGRTIQIKGGGTVRCRPDGTGIEVVSTGTRNHLEANLDDRDNIFTYDNTDDGLGWWTRVTHHIDGGYYGYPYDYHTRPDRFLNRMAEYGGGSPCGAVFYKDDAWPENYRGMGFWAEWGKGKVQAFRFRTKGASFEVAETIDFAVASGVKDFRPIDLAFSDDGRTLYVADWGMGGWGSKTEKVGRVWAISPTEEGKPAARGRDSDSIETAIGSLEHPAWTERMRAQNALIARGPDAVGPVQRALGEPGRDSVARRHLLWTLDALAGGSPGATMPILETLKANEPDLRAQAARALGLRNVPIAVEPLVGLLADPDPSVKLQALIALGRIGDPDALGAVVPLVADPDPYVAFAARVALRRVNDWKAATEAGFRSPDARVRLGVLSAMDGQNTLDAVAGLIQYALNPDHPADERAEALRFLAGAHQQAKPWDGKWWGTQPAAGKPPAKEIAWEATPAIGETVHLAIADKSIPVRLAAIAAVQEMKDQDALRLLRDRFAIEPEAEVKRSLALALGAMKDSDALPILTATLKDAESPEPLREAALTAVEGIGTEAGASALVELLQKGGLPIDREPRVLAALGKFAVFSSLPAVAEKFASPSPETRASAAKAVAGFKSLVGIEPQLRGLLADPEVEVRRAAIATLGTLKDREAIPDLLALADREETRFEATKALSEMPDPRALQVYLRGLTDKNGDLRTASGSAIGSIRELITPILEKLGERHELAPEAVAELAKIYGKAEPITRWHVVGPLPIDETSPFSPSDPIDLTAPLHGEEGRSLRWRERAAIDDRGQMNLNRAIRGASDDRAAFAYAEIDSSSTRKAQILAGSDDTLTIWINGARVYDFAERRGWNPEDARFDVNLVEGRNRVLVKCGNRGGPWQFSVAVTDPAEYAFLKGPAAGAFDPEAFLKFATDHDGSAEKGRALFADLKGLACIKCHAVSGDGGQVGPDLSDIGIRYPKDEIIRSVLYPSAKIFSGYDPVVVALTDGRVVTGIVKSDDDTTLVIQDADANRLEIAKDDIDEKKLSDVSLMPNGLAEGLTKDDFADLIAYLVALKQKPAATP